MRRQPVYFCMDITERELVAMAESQGFFVRHVNDMTIVDRVPNWAKREEPKAENLVQLPRKAKA
jgi:hypothetical protein